MSKIKSTLKETEIPYNLGEDWGWVKWKDIIKSYQQGLIRANSELNNQSGVFYFKMSFINSDGSYSFDNLPKTDATIEEIERFKIRSGDFFINVRNSKELVGKSCVVYEVGKTILYNHMLVRIVHEDLISNSFINAYLNTNFGKKLLNTCKKGTTTVIALYQKDIYNLPIPVPKKELLEKIDGIYNSINRKLELNSKLNSELEQLAKSIYDYWFVQFDFPISTEQAIAMGMPELEGKPYKSSGGKMVHDEVLKRDIPRGWTATVFSNWITETKPGDWGKDSYEGNYTERVHCIRGADINGLNGKGEVKAPERFILKNNISKSLSPNNLIVEISGGSPTQSTARIALLTEKTFQRFDSNVICSNFCKAISVKDEKYVYNFKQEWQRLYESGIFFGYEGKTSGIKNFLFDSFVNSYNVVKPDKKIVEKYFDFAKSIEDKKQSNLLQNQQLSSLRDWLLPMLINGQVKVGASIAQVYEHTSVNTNTKAEVLFDNNPLQEAADMQIAILVKRLKMKKGDVVMQKNVYNLIALNGGINPFQKAYKFEINNFGTYSAQLKKDLLNNPFVNKQRYGTNELYVINPERDKDVKHAMNKPENKGFVDLVDRLKNLYSMTFINSDSNKIELLNTVLKLNADYKTRNPKVIYRAMQNWKVELGEYKTKAEKFSYSDTEFMLRILVNKGIVS